MPSASTYRKARGASRSERTRERIMQAVRELLAEGSFHESSAELIAERAGISRATLYQHFRSRLDMVDEICDTFDRNPALLTLRETVALADPRAALAETIANTVGFWSSEDAILAQLYGVQAIDPAARDLVQRQRADRRGEMQRLARNLKRSGRLRSGLSERAALERLMVLTSYETFRELHLAGMTPKQITAELHGFARIALFR